MNWNQINIAGCRRLIAFIFAIGAICLMPAVAGGDERSTLSGSRANGASEPAPDPLDEALERAGLSRSDLGRTPQGWWLRYPRNVVHKLDHVDDLMREPLATVPFTRTLAQAARVFLGPENLKAVPAMTHHGHALHKLTFNIVDRRYGLFPNMAIRRAEANIPGAKLADATLNEAILSLYRDVGEPTRLTIGFAMVNVLDSRLEEKLAREAERLSPEVSRILGRLVLDTADAHRWAQLAFHDVSVERRMEIFRRTDEWKALELTGGIDYKHLRVFDDVAKSWDEGSLWNASLKCVEALDVARRALSGLPPDKLNASSSFDWETPLGWIRVRGTGPDVIDATDALLIVDLGGDDNWSGPVGATQPNRLIGLTLDLSGNDVYIGGRVTQGAGVAGVGILVDAEGNDRYEANSYAQGASQFGLGALFDLAGNDVYRANHSAQGSAAFGVGLLADASGKDEYHIVADGQGYGGVGGVGVLADRAGDDVYYAEPNKDKSGRPSYGKQDSASTAQGVGAARCCYGFSAGRNWAGGLGALLDIEGDDRYIAGSWSQGTGFWFGTGILYDGAGNDTYDSTTGSQGSALHYGIGALLDEGGNDKHTVVGALAFAAAHNNSVALFVALGGDDRYSVQNADACSAFGWSHYRSSAAIFIDQGGNDVYWASANCRPGTAVHNAKFVANDDGIIGDSVLADPAGGAANVTSSSAYTISLGLFLDLGGSDSYWGEYSDGAVWGDKPGSDNWKMRNVGMGVDVSGGVIDWRPISSRGGSSGSRR